MSETDKELLDALSAMVSQHCKFMDAYHSGYLTANAEAMRVLMKHGRFKASVDVTDYKKGDTRCVIGEFI